MPDRHTCGRRAAPNPDYRDDHEDQFIDAHPRAAAVLMVVTWLLALAVPAALLLAVLAHLTMLELAATCASLPLYGGGYLGAAWRRRDLRRQLRAARLDPVTGLPTRAVADNALLAATAAGTRLTVALADVDGLRAVNNGLGHAAGDQLLRTVGTRLARAVPAGGLAARLGGDEFIVLAPHADPTDLTAAIGAALAGPATIAGHRMQPRASVGIATTDHHADAHHALARADAAMYAAKDAAGNQILVYDPGRDGEPDLDGTRPLLRRRDQRPTTTDTTAWAAPRPGEHLVAVLWTAADLRTILAAVAATRDRFTEAAAEAEVGAQRPDQPTVPTGDRSINVEPTRRGYASMAVMFAAEAAKYGRMAARLRALAAIVEGTDES